MAQQIRIMFEDDLDGTELSQEQVNTVAFSVNGTSYELDLSEKNKAKFDKALTPFVDKARKVGKAPANVTRIDRARSNRTASSGGDNRAKEIRAWAVGKGLLKEDSRGRIPKDVVAQYDAEHGNVAANG